MDFISMIATSVVSGLIVAFFVGFVINRYLKRLEKKDLEKATILTTILEGNNATMLLSQAIATELIENGKCNGKTTRALEYSKEIKKKQDEKSIQILASNF